MGLGVLLGKAKGAVLEAVTESAEDLVARAMEATPIVTGTLQGSIHVEDITQTAFSVTAVVATGGEASDYAVYIHEGMRKDGTYVRVAGPAKYLEGPLIEEAPVYREALARAARGAF